ncbi:MAG: hypothetical protein COX31_00690 [Candidatus Moranbacteria bacterium CG23_combo_of_CG06-09_8_20_14_all_40_16]|nr:MAG: hypothetical protein COX31_00690 [Candidatus Moranbacteria bacterium CG23_combo_of_CG06-09_8_20_14_all_40_16]
MKLSFRKIALIFLIGLFGFFNFLNFPVKAADDSDEIKEKIEKYEDKLEDVTKELQQSQGLLQKTTREVMTTRSLIEKTSSEITRKEAEVKNLNNRIELNRKILSEYVRQVYYNDEESLLVRLALGEDSLGGILGNLNQSLGIKDRILNLLEETKKSKEELEKVKTELTGKKEEHEELLVIKKNEQAEIQQDVRETQITLAEIQQKMSKLRSTLSAFLGKSFTIDDVVKEVTYASGKTGVRKEFLFAVLDKETDLGRFTGGCTYKNSKMGATNEKIFKGICDDLGYDYKKMKVSCPLSYGIGGAMGVAQFMPSTWINPKYAPRIAAITGNKPANPWSLKDGILGMALYLKDKGGDKKSGEHTAAAAYHCGSNLSRTVCQNYANSVISWSKGYDDYF